MRFAFESDEVLELYETGYCRRLRLQPNIVRSFFKAMLRIKSAPNLQQLANNRGLRLEKLHGDRADQFSVRLNDQYRLVFTVERDDDGEFVLIIEIVDYH
ncbi:MAG: type II toxin-antitoxin system RelE/ParE family toxin [Armatimonadota bacterium]